MINMYVSVSPQLGHGNLRAAVLKPPLFLHVLCPFHLRRLFLVCACSLLFWVPNPWLSHQKPKRKKNQKKYKQKFLSSITYPHTNQGCFQIARIKKKKNYIANIKCSLRNTISSTLFLSTNNSFLHKFL